MKGYRWTIAWAAVLALAETVGLQSVRAAELTIDNLTPQLGEILVEPDVDDFVPGTIVKLTAVPNDNNLIASWDGNAGELVALYEDTFIFEIEADTHVAVSFGPLPEFELTLIIEPTGAGVILADPDPGLYAAGTEVTLAVLAAPGYAFSNWDGVVTDDVGAGEITITVERDLDVAAIFDAAAVVVDPDPDPNPGGSTASDTAGATRGACGTMGIATLGLTLCCMLAWRLRR